MQVLHEDSAGTPGVRRDFSVAIGKAFCHGHELRHSSHETGVRLSDVETVPLDKNAPLVVGCQAFASGDRNRCRSAELGVSPGIGVVEGFLKKEKVVGLAGFGHGDGGRRIPGMGGTVSHVAVEHQFEFAPLLGADEVQFCRFKVGGFVRVLGQFGSFLIRIGSHAELCRLKTE